MNTAPRGRSAPTLRRSFERYLRARNLSEQTVEGYKGYGASVADERARDAHRRLSPGDRL